jgi:hypothetical protein
MCANKNNMFIIKVLPAMKSIMFLYNSLMMTIIPLLIAAQT